MLQPNTISMTEYQNFIYLSRYSRYLHDKGRREVWSETIARYFNFFKKHLKENCGYNLTQEVRYMLEEAILRHSVMPSMRCLMTAGSALERDNIAGYNCAYLPLDCPKSFSELLYILLNGTGDGFSVEKIYVDEGKLPDIPETFYPSDTTIIVGDSKLGWAKALNELISLLYCGYIPNIDISKVRPAGSILKTFGGRASGPEPLMRLFLFVIETFKKNAGGRLSTLDCHDIACNIGDCVVVGGVRRAALISLSDLTDNLMRNAKQGQWWQTTPYRQLSNNSAIYNDKCPSMGQFIEEWKSLYDSKSGERGIISRYAIKANITRSNEFRKKYFGDNADIRYRDITTIFGTNPCSEINLRPNQFCNLTEVIVRSIDTLEDLKQKIEFAVILGTFQCTLTNFRFISKKWENNTKEERLLGVSMTGIMDNELLNGRKGIEELKKVLTELRKHAIATNLKWAKILGIEPSVAITAVKPSGTVSQLVNSSSGIHARHSQYYLRSVRNSKNDPVSKLMIEQGFPYELDQMNSANYIFNFPIKSPEGCITRHDMTAVEQLEMWKIYQVYWTEHKPSCTVSVREDEWMEVGAWVYKNFEYMCGVSFLPMSDHVYIQAPYQDLTEDEYNEWMKKMPIHVAWEKLSEYEKEDFTVSSQQLACVAGCELI